jgi:hypothetical protein
MQLIRPCSLGAIRPAAIPTPWQSLAAAIIWFLAVHAGAPAVLMALGLLVETDSTPHMKDTMQLSLRSSQR